MATLLVVDDDPDLLAILDVHCRARGHTTIGALSCEAALSVAANRPPDLILLDYCLPKMDGARFIEILRADELTKQTPVIVISALSPGWVTPRLAPDPLVSVIGKPLDFTRLDPMIEEALAARPVRPDVPGRFSWP